MPITHPPPSAVDDLQPASRVSHKVTDMFPKIAV